MYHCQFQLLSVGVQGNEMKKVVPGHKLTNPISAYSDTSQRNTLDLTEQSAH